MLAVTWRVTAWKATDDRRWQLAAYADHPRGDWQAALATSREWVRDAADDIERGNVRVVIEPVNVQLV